jgi:hypothetical protein
MMTFPFDSLFIYVPWVLLCMGGGYIIYRCVMKELKYF